VGQINYRSFKTARTFVHKLQLKNKQEWSDWIKSGAKPDDIPSNPNTVYKDKGWIGWGDWLGTGVIANQNRVFRDFEEAREYVHKLQLKNRKEWTDWTKSGSKPDDIPCNPSKVYQDKGWIDYGDWFGTGYVATFNRTYRPFLQARAYVHKLQLKNTQEWNDWIKSGEKPNDIPSNPNLIYKDTGWIGYGDWLGTGKVSSHNRTYRPFEEARDFVHQFYFKNQKDWLNWSKSGEKPDDIPSNPNIVYKDKGWNGLEDWLGN
jgi:hypothetical protein